MLNSSDTTSSVISVINFTADSTASLLPRNPTKLPSSEEVVLGLMLAVNNYTAASVPSSNEVVLGLMLVVNNYTAAFVPSSNEVVY